MLRVCKWRLCCQTKWQQCGVTWRCPEWCDWLQRKGTCFLSFREQNCSWQSPHPDQVVFLARRCAPSSCQPPTHLQGRRSLWGAHPCCSSPGLPAACSLSYRGAGKREEPSGCRAVLSASGDKIPGTSFVLPPTSVHPKGSLGPPKLRATGPCPCWAAPSPSDPRDHLRKSLEGWRSRALKIEHSVCLCKCVHKYVFRDLCV